MQVDMAPKDLALPLRLHDINVFIASFSCIQDSP